MSNGHNPNTIAFDAVHQRKGKPPKHGPAKGFINLHTDTGARLQQFDQSLKLGNVLRTQSRNAGVVVSRRLYELLLGVWMKINFHA